MSGQNCQSKSGYYIGNSNSLRPFGQMSLGAFGKVRKASDQRRPHSVWISSGMAVFAVGLSAYSLHVLDSLKNQVLTERMVVLERFDESEETLRRVGAILNFLVKDKDMSEVPATAETTPLTVTTSTRTSIKKSPQSKAETLMLIAKNSKLVVVGKEDDWIQVIAPTGERGWINEGELMAGEAVNG